MTRFEITYLCAERLLPALYGSVRRRLVELASSREGRPSLLDVGGRKSHYTIGVPAAVIISDLPRHTQIRKRLHLGIDTEIARQTHRRRSNVRGILYDDMTRSSFRDCCFDCVAAVEVLEHVAADAAFLEEVRRVLKPSGMFLMTTPNGDSVPNHNPDHKRHYTREQLRSLLTSTFGNGEVEYAIPNGIFYSLGLRPWSGKHPVRTMLSMVGALVNSMKSRRSSVKQQARGTQHLLGMARKAN